MGQLEKRKDGVARETLTAEFCELEEVGSEPSSKSRRKPSSLNHSNTRTGSDLGARDTQLPGDVLPDPRMTEHQFMFGSCLALHWRTCALGVPLVVNQTGFEGDLNAALGALYVSSKTLPGTPVPRIEHFSK